LTIFILGTLFGKIRRSPQKHFLTQKTSKQKRDYAQLNFTLATTKDISKYTEGFRFFDAKKE